MKNKNISIKSEIKEMIISCCYDIFSIKPLNRFHINDKRKKT